MEMHGQLIQAKAASILAVSATELTLSTSNVVVIPLTYIEGPYDGVLYSRPASNDRIITRDSGMFKAKYRCGVEIEGFDTGKKDSTRSEILMVFLAVNGQGLNRSISYGNAYQLDVVGNQTLEFTLDKLNLRKDDYVQLAIMRMTRTGTVKLKPNESHLLLERISR